MTEKTLQTIIGHGDIKTTMNNYVDVVSLQSQLQEINALANAITN